MGIFSRKVEQTDQEIADSLAASGLSLFTQARDSLAQANELNDQIIAESIEASTRAAKQRDATIAAAHNLYEEAVVENSDKINTARAAASQNRRALDALATILGS